MLSYHHVAQLRMWQIVTGLPISKKLLDWTDKRRIKLEHIQPGKPQQNAYIERYNRTVRYDWLGQLLFASISEVQEFATSWL